MCTCRFVSHLVGTRHTGRTRHMCDVDRGDLVWQQGGEWRDSRPPSVKSVKSVKTRSSLAPPVKSVKMGWRSGPPVKPVKVPVKTSVAAAGVWGLPRPALLFQKVVQLLAARPGRRRATSRRPTTSSSRTSHYVDGEHPRAFSMWRMPNRRGVESCVET